MLVGKMNGLAMSFIFFNGPLEFLSQVLPLALGLLLQKSGIELTTASLVSMYIATMNLSGPIQRIMYSISDIQRSQTVKEKYFHYWKNLV